MGATEELTKFLVKTNFNSLPRETVERAKELVLDFVRGSLGGSQSPVGKTVIDYIRNIGARQESTVIGGKFRTAAAFAAYVNATLAHSLELEAVGSTGPNIAQDIAVALSLCERLGLPGWKLIESIVLGFEVQARVWNGSVSGASARGWVQPFNHVGAVGVAAKLLGLDVDQTRAALGTALAQANGMNCQAGHSAHYLTFAYPSYTGVEAAEYALRGIGGNPEILEAPQGFCDQFAGEGSADYERMTKDLGMAYAILPPGTCIKKYPCCYLSHSAIDALLDLIEEHDISYKYVESVQVDINRLIASWVRYSEPITEHEARFSFKHLLGTAILEKDVWLPSFTKESVLSQRYRAARDKIKVIIHSEWPQGWEGMRSPVSIRLKDGRTYTKEIRTPREPSSEEVMKRYKEASQVILPSSDVERSIKMITELEKLRRTDQLMDILRTK